MVPETLERLYADELASLCDAERQQARALPEMARRVATPPLATLLNEHAAETQSHARRLEGLLSALDTACITVCEPMREILDGAARSAHAAGTGPGTEGAILLSAARVEQYEIGAYFNLLAIARLLGRAAECRLYREVLEEEGRVRRRLEGLMQQVLAPDSAGLAPGTRAEPAAAVCLMLSEAAPTRPGCDAARRRRARPLPLARWGRRWPACGATGW